jgi:hypothetical protein
MTSPVDDNAGTPASEPQGHIGPIPYDFGVNEFSKKKLTGTVRQMDGAG